MCLLRDTAPLLMLPYLLPPPHYHSVLLSLPPEARTLAPAAWQPLVSLTQLLCCLSHSQHPPLTPPLSATPGLMQQPQCAIRLFLLFSSHLLPSLASLALLKMTLPKCDRHTTAEEEK